MPLLEHEKAKIIIGDLLKILLDELEMNWEPFSSTTFKRKDMQAGIEPDDCFYIQNYARMIGKDRLDLTIDPPPDLAIEVDLISKTKLSVYEALGVPEIWRYKNQRLQINILQDGKYLQSLISPSFPNFPITEVIPAFISRSLTEGTSATLRAFRQWVMERIEK